MAKGKVTDLNVIAVLFAFANVSDHGAVHAVNRLAQYGGPTVTPGVFENAGFSSC